MKPAMLERAIATGSAPAMKLLMERGSLVDDCVAAFPSVTPVCAATIATGVGPDRHEIPSMNWYHRDEGRYVEYGTSFSASRTFGIKRSLTDTIYNMNGEHLSARRRDGVRDARRRRRAHRRHDVPDVPRPPRARGDERHRAHAARHDGVPQAGLRPARVLLRRPVRLAQDRLPLAARAARACATGTPAASARTWSSTTCSTSCCCRCPTTTRTRTATARSPRSTSIAEADRQIERLMHAAGGPDAFLEDHAVIVCSDHSQSQVEREIDLFAAFDGFELEPPAPPRGAATASAEIALCPASRSAQVYILDRDRRAELLPRLERTALALDGVDLVMHMTDHPDGEAVVRGARGELRFMPGGELTDLRGERWSVEGDLELLDLQVRDGVVASALYPDALGRIWSALRCRDVGGDAAVGDARLRVHRLGRRPPRRRRLARLAARQRLARRAAVVRHRARQRRREGAVVAARHRADGPRALRRPRREGRRSALAGALLALAALAPGPPRQRLPSPADYDAPPAGWRTAPADVLRTVAARPEVRRGARRARADLRPRLLQEPGEAALAGVVLRAAGAARRAHARAVADRRRRPQRAACSRAGRATRSSGRWRAATPARSGAWPTRCGSGCRCARCSCSRSRAPPLRLLHLDLRGAARVLGLARVLQRGPDRRRVPLVYPLLAYLLARMLGIAFSRRAARAAAPCA